MEGLVLGVELGVVFVLELLFVEGGGEGEAALVVAEGVASVVVGEAEDVGSACELVDEL